MRALKNVSLRGITTGISIHLSPFLIMLFLLTFPFKGHGQGQKKELELIVECVEYVGNGMYKANFGYDNPTKKTISVNSSNSYVLYNKGQSKKNVISDFAPGRQYNVFSQEFTKDDKCEWILTLPDGTQKTKSSSINSVHCINSGDILPYYDPTGSDENIGSELNSLYYNYQRTGSAETDDVFIINTDQVLIDIIVNEGKLSQALGLLAGTYGVDPLQTSINDLIITTYFPIAFLLELNDYDEIINYVRNVYPAISNGFPSTGILSQGDEAQRSDIARNKYQLGGNGIKVGVLSDSYNLLNGESLDIGSGDLPAGVQVSDGMGNSWDNAPFGSDEGRAMLQIVHDVTPLAELAFRTGFNSESDFAQGILDLYQKAACDVIVDDLTYVTAPFYRSGLVSQAIDYVTSQGVIYLTSAGNFGTDGWEDIWTPAPGPNQNRHDFGKNGDFLQRISVEKGNYMISFQWDNPWYSDEPAGGSTPIGADMDFNIYIADGDGNILFGFNRNNLGGDPYEILPFTVVADAAQANLIIEKVSGPDVPVRLKYVVFRKSSGFLQEYSQGTSTIVGHAANPNAITVAATRWDDLQKVENFSSRGSAISTELGYNKPDVTAPNGGNVTVISPAFTDYSGDDDSSPNFFGTSAAAPHAAGVVAMILEARNFLGASVPDIKNALKTGIKSIGPAFEAGAGFLQADAIMGSLIAPVPQNISLSYSPEDSIPGLNVITVIVDADFISSGSQIYVNGVPLETAFTDNGDGTFTLTASVEPFIGDPPVQIFNPGINGSEGRLSDPVSFFEGKKTIILSADLTGAEDASKKYGEVDPPFSIKYLDGGIVNENGAFAELDQATKDLIDPLLQTYIQFTTNQNPVWQENFVGVNYAIEPLLSDQYYIDQENGLELSYNFQFQNGQLAIFQMPVEIKANDLTLTYGDEINITYDYLIVDETTGQKFEIENFPGLISAQEFREFLDGSYADVVSDTIAVITNGKPYLNGKPFLNGTTYLVSYSILKNGKPFLNGKPYLNSVIEIDADVINAYIDPENPGSAIRPDGGYNVEGSFINGKAFLNGKAYVNGKAFINGKPFLNGQAFPEWKTVPQWKTLSEWKTFSEYGYRK
jgi:hypothetical protein